MYSSANQHFFWMKSSSLRPTSHELQGYRFIRKHDLRLSTCINYSLFLVNEQRRPIWFREIQLWQLNMARIHFIQVFWTFLGKLLKATIWEWCHLQWYFNRFMRFHMFTFFFESIRVFSVSDKNFTVASHELLNF